MSEELKPKKPSIVMNNNPINLNIKQYFKENPSIKFFMSKIVFFNFLFTPFMVFFSLYHFDFLSLALTNT